ncbi:uncharacterized protein LOC120158120 [Hibiscus syriacus]|uniref:uncharacterized protein LOC120158120 n=1 Tax=Hibiscus syriacus TaxID=106335 RepID=UPI001924EF4C|nr:uncharacterized protein LOC120158120 [Hibiscus syriacus]
MSSSDLNPSNDLSVSDYLAQGDLQLDLLELGSLGTVLDSDNYNVSALSVDKFAQSLLEQGLPDDIQETLLTSMPSGSNIRGHHGAILLSSDQQLNSLSLMLSGSNKRDQHGVNGQQSLANDNQVKSLSSMPSGSKRRGRELVSDDSSKPKGKGKMKQPQRRRTIVNGESAPTSKAVPLSYEDRIKEKSVGESAKILTDRVSKRTESVMALLGDLFLAYDKMPWTARAQELKADSKAMRGELKRINRYIINILVKCKKGRLTEEAAKKRLVGAHNRLNNFLQKIENAREGLKQINRDLEKTRNLDAIFAKNMDFSSEYLREKLASEIPFDIKELDLVDLHSKFSNFKSRLYDKENNKVDIQDFEGLQEALNRAGWGKTPNHLEQIAMEVETAIGKQINNPCIRVLLSAAIKEMKDLKVDEMERDMCNMFKKWAATFNYAKENGFHVEFAYIKLEKNLRAYLSYHGN